MFPTSCSSDKFLWTGPEGWKHKETPKKRVIPHDSTSLGNQPENSKKHFQARSTEKKRSTAAQANSPRGSSPPRVAARSWKKLPISFRKCAETQQLWTHFRNAEINLVETIDEAAKGAALPPCIQDEAWQDVLLRMHLPFLWARIQPGSRYWNEDSRVGQSCDGGWIVLLSEE